MSQLTDLCLGMLGDWSIRWGLLALAVCFWLSIKPFKSASLRHSLCLAVLACGFLLPFSPGWSVETSLLGETPRGPLTETVEWSSNLPDRHEVTAQREPLIEPAATGPKQPDSQQLTPVVPAGGVRDRLPSLRGVLTVAWLVTASVLLTRVIAGHLAIRRIKSGATEVGQASQTLMARILSELALSRSVTLATHPVIQTPILTGGRHPMILVPSSWDTLPEADRRACLIHELCHLARRDDWIKLLEEVARSFVFFHPMAWWLFARIDHERELICDEEVVARGVEPLRYARLLLDYAKAGKPLVTAQRIHALPLFHSKTIASRINRLMEDNMAHQVSRPSIVKRGTIVATTMALAMLVGGLHFRAIAQAPPVSPNANQASNPASTTNQKPRVLRGAVVDFNYNPVAGASILATSHPGGFEWHPSDKVSRKMQETDENGEFSVELPPSPLTVEVFAYKAPYAVAHGSTYLWKQDDTLSEMRLKLTKPVPFEMVLVDEHNKPIANAEVRIESIASVPFVSKGKLTGVNDHSSTTAIQYDRLQWRSLENSPIEQRYSARSDADGLIRFEKLGAIGGIRFSVRVPGRGTYRADPFSMEGNRSLIQSGYITSGEGSAPRVKLRPVARVVGQLTTRLPNTSLSGVSVELNALSIGTDEVLNRHLSTKTNDKGQFFFEDLFPETVTISLDQPTANGSWTYEAASNISLDPGTSTNVSIDLIEGVQAEGRVVSSEDGQGVPKAKVWSRNGAKPRSNTHLVTVTDDEGVYRFRVPKGAMQVSLYEDPDGYTQLSEVPFTVKALIDGASPRVTLDPIKVKPGTKLRGRIIDHSGYPVPRASIVSLQREGLDPKPVPFEGIPTLLDGDFHLYVRDRQFAPRTKVKVGLFVEKYGKQILVDSRIEREGTLSIRLPREEKPIQEKKE